MSEEKNSVANDTSSVAPNDIKSKVVKSAKWTTAQSVINMVYGPIYKIALAMFISPTGFAYISALLIVLNIGDLLNKIGFSQALIVEKESGSRQFSTVFWIDVASAFLISAVIMICSPWIEAFYELEGLKEMVLLLGPCVLFSGMTRTFRCYLQKELRHDTTVKIDILKVVLDSTLSIVFIVWTKSMIGYVYGTLISRFTMMVCLAWSAFRQGYRMGFHFDVAFIKKIKGFASSVTFRQILDYVVHIIDELIIARLFSDKSVLGIYFFAKDLIAKPQQVITSAVSQVALSALAKFNDNVKKVGAIFLKMSKYLAIAAFPVFTGLAVTSGEFLPALFGNEYAGADIYIQCFCISAMFVTLSASPGSAVLYALKKPNALLYIDIANSSIYLLALFGLGRFGVIYILVAKMISTAFSVSVTHIVTRKSLGLSMAEYAKNVAVPFAATILMAIGVILVKIVVPESLGVWVELGISVAIGGIAYLAIIFTREKQTIKELLSMVKRR